MQLGGKESRRGVSSREGGKTESLVGREGGEEGHHS